MATKFFPEDGWYRCEKFDQVVFLRGATKESRVRPGHYHQDLGHFSLYRAGTSILVDGGRKHYLGDEWGNFGVFPEAHNTITVDNYGLSPRRPQRFPPNYSRFTHDITVEEGSEVLRIDIHSSGFRRIQKEITWNRTIMIFKNSFEVKDVVEGVDERLIQTFFHFSESLELMSQRTERFHFFNPIVSGVFDCVLPKGYLMQRYRGGESPIGWQAVSYGKAVPATTIVCAGSVYLPVECKYTITWNLS